MNINLLITVPAGFSTTLTTDAQGNITATQAQIDVKDAIDSIIAEPFKVGSTATQDLWKVITIAKDLALIQGMIAQYKLPMTIIHAQTFDGSTVLIEAKEADLLPFMPDVVTYSADGMTIKSTAKATVVGKIIPAGGHAEIYHSGNKKPAPVAASML